MKRLLLDNLIVLFFFQKVPKYIIFFSKGNKSWKLVNVFFFTFLLFEIYFFNKVREVLQCENDLRKFVERGYLHLHFLIFLKYPLPSQAPIETFKPCLFKRDFFFTNTNNNHNNLWKIYFLTGGSLPKSTSPSKSGKPSKSGSSSEPRQSGTSSSEPRKFSKFVPNKFRRSHHDVSERYQLYLKPAETG